MGLSIALLGGMPDLQDADVVGHDAVRDQVVAMDDQLTSAGSHFFA